MVKEFGFITAAKLACFRLYAIPKFYDFENRKALSASYYNLFFSLQ